MARELWALKAQKRKDVEEGHFQSRSHYYSHSHSHYELSTSHHTREKPPKTDLTLRQLQPKVQKIDFKATLAEKVIEKVHRKLADKQMKENVDDFFQSKESFHSDLLPFPCHWGIIFKFY